MRGLIRFFINKLHFFVVQSSYRVNRRVVLTDQCSSTFSITAIKALLLNFSQTVVLLCGWSGCKENIILGFSRSPSSKDFLSRIRNVHRDCFGHVFFETCKYFIKRIRAPWNSFLLLKRAWIRPWFKYFCSLSGWVVSSVQFHSYSSRVACGAHPSLLTSWAARPLSQLIRQRWRVNDKHRARTVLGRWIAKNKNFLLYLQRRKLSERATPPGVLTSHHHQRQRQHGQVRSRDHVTGWHQQWWIQRYACCPCKVLATLVGKKAWLLLPTRSFFATRRVSCMFCKNLST